MQRNILPSFACTPCLWWFGLHRRSHVGVQRHTARGALVLAGGKPSSVPHPLPCAAHPWGSAVSSPLQVTLKSSSSDNKFDATEVGWAGNCKLGLCNGWLAGWQAVALSGGMYCCARLPRCCPPASPPIATLASTAQVAVTLTDRKGDTLAYPKVVGQLPFTDAASTAGLGDNFSVVCGSTEAGDNGGASVSEGVTF